MKHFLPSTTEKVPINTNKKVNEQIKKQCIQSLYSNKDNKAALSDRIKKLNREWDTERFLETNAALIIFAGSLIGILTKNFYWFLLPGFISFFLLQHALQGWCPPLPLIRRAGFRTAAEIYSEKTALKALRGDYANDPKEIEKLILAVEKQ